MDFLAILPPILYTKVELADAQADGAQPEYSVSRQGGPAMSRCLFTASMLGEFQIHMDGKPIHEPLGRSKKVKQLLEYLLYHRRLVPMGELYEVFWPQVKSPKNALKVLVHRLRAALEQGGVPQDVECILQRQGGYEWNPALETTLDIDQFESCYREATSGQVDRDRQAELLGLGLGLYRGRFLSDTALWTAAPAESLHNAYRKMVQQMCTLFKEKGHMEQLVDLCRGALCYDALDESLHREMILGLLACGRSQDALAHYRNTTDLFYRELGIPVSEELRALYHHILETDGAVELDIDSIRDKLEEKAPSTGAFVCEYGIFKDLYRIEARCLDRYGGRVFLGLLTVSSAHHEQFTTRALARQMELLLEVARTSLRKGDVISRFSASQYVLLLPTVTYESGTVVLERIRTAFRRAYPKAPVAILVKLRPLKPVEGDNSLCTT